MAFTPAFASAGVFQKFPLDGAPCGTRSSSLSQAEVLTSSTKLNNKRLKFFILLFLFFLKSSV